MSGYVYLMKNARNGYYKIGFTRRNVKYRESTLQAEEPEVETVCFAHSYLEVEGILHRNFKDKRIRGEWFSLDDTDVIKLKALFDAFEEQGKRGYLQ